MEKVKSKYLAAFQNAKTLELQGNVLLVERIKPQDIKRKSGLYIPQADKVQVNAVSSERPEWAIVLAVGEGYYEEGGKEVPVDAKPGDLLLVGSLSVRYFGTAEVIQDAIDLPEDYEPYSIGVTRESEAQIKIRGGAEPCVSGTAKAQDDQLELVLGV